MPDITVPGVGDVTFPDSMSHDQIVSAIETDILPKYRASHPVPAAPTIPAEAPSRWERFGHGASQVTQGVTQLMLKGLSALPSETPSPQELRDNFPGSKLTDAQLLAQYQAGQQKTPLDQFYTDRKNSGEALYGAGRKAQGGGFDGYSALGGAAAMAPAMVAAPAVTIPARILQGAIAGGIGGAAEFQPDNSLASRGLSSLEGAGTGAVLGPVAGAVGDALVAGGRRLIGGFRGREVSAADILKQFPQMATAAPDAKAAFVQEARQQFMDTGTVNVEQMQRKANIIANGGTPTRSMVTRSPADWSRERNLQKLGSNATDPQLADLGQQLTDVYQGNNRAFADRFQGMTPAAGTQEAHGMTVMSSLDDMAKASQKDVSKLYDHVRTASGDQLASDARELHSTLDELRDNAYADPVIDSVTRKLKRYGMLDTKGELTDNTLTVTQAEELRKFVNALPQDAHTAAPKAAIVRAIDSDVLSGTGGDAFQGARSAASARFAMLDNPATQKALGSWGELAQGKTAQNFVQSQLVNAPEQDVKSLLATLDNLPAADRAQAQQAIVSGVMQHLEQKALDVNSGKLSGAALNKAIANIGESKLIMLIGPDRFAQLRSLTRATLDTSYEPPFSAVNHSNSAPAIAAWMDRARAGTGVPLLLNDTAQKLTTRAGYARQLRQALGARSEQLMPQLPAPLRDIFGLLGPAAAPAGVSLLDERRKRPRLSN